jgi:hypothetical protein
MQTVYVVKAGDNLWQIARNTLGHGSQWPRLWRYNNRPEVTKVTGRPIPNPDLIYVGQKLLIPIIPGQTPTPSGPQSPLGPPPLPAQGPKAAPARPTISGSSGPLSGSLGGQSAPIAVKFDKVVTKWSGPVAPYITVEWELTASAVLSTTREYSIALSATSGSVEAAARNEISKAFGQLMGETTAEFDPTTKKVKFQSGFRSRANPPYAPEILTAIETVGPGTISLRYEVKPQDLMGTINDLNYAAEVKFSMVVTLSTRGPIPALMPIPVTEPVRVRNPVPVEQRSIVVSDLLPVRSDAATAGAALLLLGAMAYVATLPVSATVTATAAVVTLVVASGATSRSPGAPSRRDGAI